MNYVKRRKKHNIYRVSLWLICLHSLGLEITLISFDFSCQHSSNIIYGKLNMIKHYKNLTQNIVKHTVANCHSYHCQVCVAVGYCYVHEKQTSWQVCNALLHILSSYHRNIISFSQYKILEQYHTWPLHKSVLHLFLLQQLYLLLSGHIMFILWRFL